MTDLDQYLFARRIPYSVLFELTSRCNLACAHCYRDASIPQEDELGLGTIQRILKELGTAGTFSIVFSGGEAFLRKDAIRILTRARQLNFAVCVYTNGTLIGGAEARALEFLQLDRLEISIYGDSAEIHDSITGHSGSFELACKAGRLLRASGQKVVLKCVVMRENLECLSGMKRLAEILGADFHYDPMIIPQITGGCHNLCGRLTDNQLAAYVEGHSELSLYRALLQRVSGPVKNKNLPVCLAGTSLCSIAANGDIFPCMTMRQHRLGNLRKESFAELWRKAEYLQSVLALERFTECLACENMPICAWCPGHAELEHGSLYVPVREFCRLTGAIRASLDRANGG